MIFWVEGEKNADALRDLGLIATTSHGGAKSIAKCFGKDLAPYFVGAKLVVVLYDADAPGRFLRDVIVNALVKLGVRVVVVHLGEGLPEGYDISDWLKQGHTRAELEALVEAAPEAKASASSPETAKNEGPSRKGPGRPSDAPLLEKATQRSLSLFHDERGVAYARVKARDHVELHRVNSTTFELFAMHQFYLANGRPPGADALKTFTSLVEAKARFDSPERRVFDRYAKVGDAMYVDLCDSNWRQVRVTAKGWEVISAEESPAYFKRRATAKPLPVPVRGGRLIKLRPCLNAKSDHVWALIQAFLLSPFQFEGGLPVLAVLGYQGSVKTRTSERIRRVLDPDVVLLNSPPKSLHDLAVVLSQCAVGGFDNISRIASEFSDAICRCTTGGGDANRTLYKNDEITVLTPRLPIIINGIDDMIARADLADRAITLRLDIIPESERRPDSEVEAEFEEALPEILGALYDAVAVGLKKFPDTRLESYPRLADFAKWVTACESGLGFAPGTSLEIFNANRRGEVQKMVNLDTVGSALLRFARGSENGFYGDSLARLFEHFRQDPLCSGQDNWPRNNRSFSEALRRVAVSLQTLGVKIHLEHRENGAWVSIQDLSRVRASV